MTVGKSLRRPALVLNRNWQPVNVISVARALVMVWNSTARVVDPADYQTYDWSDWSALRPQGDEPFVRAVRYKLRVPEVVSLTTYDRCPDMNVSFSRRNLFRRDRYTCQYCGAQPGSEELSIDHVVPRSQGGETLWINCVLACLQCNLRKANRTPRQASMRLKKEPEQPRWSPMFAGYDAQHMASWSKFVSEAYWNVTLK